MVSKISMMLGGRQPIQDLIRQAKDAEAAGLHSVWSGDGGGDVFGLLTPFAMTTSTIGLGSSLALWHRPPVVTAGATAQLARLSSDRLILGLGPGPRDRNEDWWGIPWDRPIGRMREYITIIRAVLEHRGRYAFHGKHFRIENYAMAAQRPDKRVPIWLGTVGVQMNELAGEIADGVLFDVCLGPRYIRDVAIPAIERGLRKAGRKREEFEIAAGIPCWVNDDLPTALRGVKRSVVSHLEQPYFYPVWAGDGYEAEARESKRRLDAGDREGALDAISDEMADYVGIAGNADRARARAREWLGIVDSVKMLPPAFLVTSPEVIDNRDQIIKAFAGF
jgi:alkanesulfonate monooxygenase SsuD/methylene tetrahydromethanopterin reductase-like flavin-dependent oxidoreductase (luciferase family)